MNYPYVYKGIHRDTGEFYIGFRKKNIDPAHKDLGHKYFTSSRDVIELGFENFDWAVISEFTDPDRTKAGNDAYDFEQKLISEDFDSPLCLNRSCYHGKARFKIDCHTEEAKQKMRKPKHTEESKAKMSEYRKGTTQSENTKQKISDSLKGVNNPNFGKTFSEERRKEMSEAAKNRVRIECPHCGKTAAPGMFNRWHGDKCKSR
jgi:hypothetical protein